MTLLDQLQIRKISKVYYVDDENAPPRLTNQDELVSAVVEASLRRLRTLVNRVEAFRPILDLRQQYQHRDADREEMRLDVEREVGSILEQLEPNDFATAGAVLFQGYRGDTARALRQPFPDNRLEPLSFSDWLLRAKEIVDSASPDERILVLVDEFNVREPDTDLNGTKLIADLWTNHENALPNIDLIILTSNCEPNAEFEEAKRVLEDVRGLAGGLVKQRTYVISKTRLSAGQLDTQFVTHLNRLRASELRAELTTRATDALHEAIRDSLNWLERIPLSEFQGSVFASSVHEGTSEIETLLRLVGIKQRTNLEKKLRTDAGLTDAVAKLRAFTLDVLDASYVTAAQTDIRELRTLEFERPGSHVNSLHSALVCGDVFEFTSGDETKEAMLLASPCDLVVRPEGERKLRRGWLVSVQRSTVAAEKAATDPPPLRYRLPTGKKDDDIVYVFDNSNVESVDLAILDLCVFESDGLATVSRESIQGAFQSLLPPLQRRAELLLARVGGRDLLKFELWGKIYEPSYIDFNPLQIGAATQSVGISYAIRRTWRMAPEFSSAVLTSLSQCMARPVFGHNYLHH